MSQPSEQSTLEFLRLIWPAEGHYCIAIKAAGNGGMRQTFFTDMAQAAEFAQLASSKGLEVYHACASFREPGSRKAANAQGARALWLDIDVGQDKPYKDDRSALAAVFSFCSATGLPAPLVVHSGGGWHVYWVLAQTLSPESWKTHAVALKALCARHGLEADPSRTADIASILRPVGTQNYKRDVPSNVVLKHVPETPATLAALGAPRPAVNNSKFEVHTVEVEQPSYAARVAANCKQLALLRDTQGRLPEPVWYAGLCVLAHCADGEQFGHEWSKGDERYAYEATAKKLQHAKRDSGPSTCDKFQSLNPDTCVGCPHSGKIKSPIQLGRAEPGSVGAESAPAIIVNDNVEVPHPPAPFFISKTGALCVTEIDPETGNKVAVVIYRSSLFLESIRQHETTGIMSLIIKHHMPQEGWQEAAVPWIDRSQKAVINAMGSQKINVHRAQERRMLNFIEASIDDFNTHRKTEMEFAQFGWRDDCQAFLLGNELHTPKGVTFTGLTPELSGRSKQMKAFGSYEEWRKAVQPLFVHEQQGIMVVAGFASVLLRFVQDMTGVIIAAVSPEPRLGKTMGLVAARSIWGDDNCIDIATNDTSNSRFRMLSVLNGLPATWDDMRKSNDPEIIKQFVLSFSQGRDKNRLDRAGALRTNASGWSSVLLATSNISIVELVGHDGETAQQARILEFRFQPMPNMKYSDGQGYERAMRQNRGTAGRRFVQALMLPGMVDWLRQAIPAYVAEFETSLARSDASFYASLLACIKASAIILNRTGMLEFSADRLIAFAIRSAQMMGEVIADNIRTPASVVTRFINENTVMNALIVMDAWKPKTEAAVRQNPRGKLVMRYEINTKRIYIDRDYFKRWCREQNIMYRDIRDQLARTKVIYNENKRVSLGAGTPFSAAGQTNCFEIMSDHPELGGLSLVEDYEGPEKKVEPVPPIVKRVLVPGKLRAVSSDAP